MVRNFHLILAVFLLGLLFSVSATAQTTEWQPDTGSVALGDVARSLRNKKSPDPAPQAVIDNDNLSKVMEDADSQRQNGKPVFSVDSARNQFQMSSPDGSCSLSFSAEAASLISTPYVAQDLPDTELAKLDGPAAIHGKTLQISVHNGSSWDVKEITVGLTIVRRDAPTSAAAYYGTANYGTAKLIRASAADDVQAGEAQTEKHPDSTVLYHLKGWAASQATTLFEENLEAPLDAGQEWHWAIVQARGTPPKSDATPASNAMTPATSNVNPTPTATVPQMPDHQQQ